MKTWLPEPEFLPWETPLTSRGVPGRLGTQGTSHDIVMMLEGWGLAATAMVAGPSVDFLIQEAKGVDGILLPQQQKLS